MLAPTTMLAGIKTDVRDARCLFRTYYTVGYHPVVPTEEDNSVKENVDIHGLMALQKITHQINAFCSSTDAITINEAKHCAPEMAEAAGHSSII